jgi:hypothetical protein
MCVCSYMRACVRVRVLNVQVIGESYLEVMESYPLIKWLTFLGVFIALCHNVVL